MFVRRLNPASRSTLFKQSFLSCTQLVKTRNYATSDHELPESIGSKKINLNFEARVPKVDFSNVAGLDEVKVKLNKVVRLMKNPKEMQSLGISIPRGVLLYGPPGTGKTLIAEAIAGEAEWDIIVMSGSDFTRQYIGQAEEEIPKLFNALNNYERKAVLFIDEIDSIGSRFSEVRTSAELHENTKINALLAAISSLKSHILLIGATNNIEALDEALVRAGRIDYKIEIPLPDQLARKEIFQLLMQGKKINNDVNFEMLATLSQGYSGAIIANIINEAAMQAFDRKAMSINSSDFQAANLIYSAGFKTRRLGYQDKFNTARHEAGHAIIAHLLNYHVTTVTIEPRSKEHAFVDMIRKNDNVVITLNEMLDLICIKLAGRASELVDGERLMSSRKDIQEAIKLAEQILEDGHGSSITGLNKYGDIDKIINQQLGRAQQLLKEHKEERNRLIQVLINEGTIDKNRFLETILVGALQTVRASPFTNHC